MKVVHLPIYCTDAYQPLLMKSLASHGVIAINGGGGGNFFRTGLFRLPAQPVDATQALNLSAGVSNPKVFRGRSFS